MTFGERLRYLLQKRKITQQELADELDIPRNTIWRWINDKTTPESNNLQILATFLQMSVDGLLNDQPEQSEDWTITIRIADNFEKEEIDLTGNIQPVAQITATPKGCAFTIQADWSMLENKKGLEQLFKRFIKDTYPSIRGNGVALGGIKD